MNKVKPIVKGLDKQIKVYLGKRLEDICDTITFTCPECGCEMDTLDDPADLEYGSFYGMCECSDCGVQFEEDDYKVEAYVVISKASK